MNVYQKINADIYTNKLPRFTGKSTKEEAAEYIAESRRLRNLFRDDALEEVGLTGHPKALEAFNLAWDEQHHSGKREVVEFLESLATLLV
jgi:hypothetical protein